MCLAPTNSDASETADLVVDTVHGVFERDYVSGSVVHVPDWELAVQVYEKLVAEDFSAIVDPFGRPLPGQVSVLYGDRIPWIYPPQSVTHVFSTSRAAMARIEDPAGRLTFVDL